MLSTHPLSNSLAPSVIAVAPAIVAKKSKLGKIFIFKACRAICLIVKAIVIVWCFSLGRED
jgi:hypothetical protein